MMRSFHNKIIYEGSEFNVEFNTEIRDNNVTVVSLLLSNPTLILITL